MIDSDMTEFCNAISRHLKSVKFKANANKKEEATLNFKNIKDVFIDNEKYEEDFRKFFRQLEVIYTKWLSYDRRSFKAKSVKDVDGLIKMVESIKNNRMKK